MEQKSVEELDKQLSNAYSYDMYRNGWIDSIKMLRTIGFNDRQIEAILRSKWTRWAAYGSDEEYGEATASDLKRFMDDKSSEEVDELTREHFGE